MTIITNHFEQHYLNKNEKKVKVDIYLCRYRKVLIHKVKTDMNKILLILLIGMNFNSFGQINHNLVILDSENNEAIIGAEIYSFIQNNCFATSNINGFLEVTTNNPVDTFFQIQSIGYKHKKINRFELLNLDTVWLKQLNTSITLGSNSFTENEYENFHRKCSNTNIRGYINQYTKGRWISNWGSFIGGDPSQEAMMVGTILNIYKDTLVVENYYFNSMRRYESFQIEIRNDTLFGKFVNKIDINSMWGQIDDCCCGERDSIEIPLCMLRLDCVENFKYPDQQQGFRRSPNKVKKWKDIENLVANWQPMIERIKMDTDENRVDGPTSRD